MLYNSQQKSSDISGKNTEKISRPEVVFQFLQISGTAYPIEMRLLGEEMTFSSSRNI